jgi:UDP-N-acetylglucosamine--dolichyl-phosphate N-acetylglucosaminephosphotransferase
MLSTFSVHSINILAGINGVEVGQAVVIAASLCVNSAMYLDPRAGEPGSWASKELRDRHLFSLSLLVPFCGCALGLLRWNR